MNYTQLAQNIKKKKSFLCVGLDPDIKKIPKHLLSEKEPLFSFCRQIIDTTAPFAVAFKPNTAFFEAEGASGWQQLEKTIAYIKTNYPEILIIADAKRGDIGNTSAMYARTFFQTMQADAVTVAPYMGSDSVTPFTGFDGKWVVLLALTSNNGAFDFQFSEIKSGERLFEKVLKESMNWGSKENMMYVVGATKAEYFKDIRKIVPQNFLLVPGVGAQGGSLAQVCQYGMNENCGLLVNSSRGIIYASGDLDFAKIAGEKAEELQKEMSEILRSNSIN
ncbi:MAG: orotidine-5'-phosphate decarboxylase [Flavobacteriales bacterium]|nr:orotidine-5'-phosphate decarboxylase [Flavobacteriales bacterium]